MAMTPAAPFRQALTIDEDGDVWEVDIPSARQAIDLHLAMGGDVKTLLLPYQWYYYPHCVLSLAFDGDDLDRECRLHAVWAARRVLNVIEGTDRADAEHALTVASRFARGDASEVREAWTVSNAASIRADDAAFAASRKRQDASCKWQTPVPERLHHEEDRLFVVGAAYDAVRSTLLVDASEAAAEAVTSAYEAVKAPEQDKVLQQRRLIDRMPW